MVLTERQREGLRAARDPRIFEPLMGAGIVSPAARQRMETEFESAVVTIATRTGCTLRQALRQLESEVAEFLKSYAGGKESQC